MKSNPIQPVGDGRPGATVSRRTALRFLSLAGVLAVGGYALFEYAPWLDVQHQADLERQPFEKKDVSTPMRELVRFATLAANGHNTQPWTFRLLGQTIEIRPDHARHLAVVDPNNRELWISLGCALENLLVAAHATGYATEVSYPTDTDVICVHLTADRPQPSRLFEAIPLRQNTRSEYDGQPIERAKLEPIQAVAAEPGVELRFMLGQAETNTVLEYVNQGNLAQYAEKAFVQELIHWLRFNKREAMTSLDGLYSRCSGNPEVPRWIGQMFVAGAKPQQQADADAKKLRSSSGVLLITSQTDDKTAWVRTGQVYERLALTMTSLDVKSAFLNQPIEVAGLRGQFQSAAGLGSALPQLLVRFGQGNPMPRSLRRPVEQVLEQS